MSVVSYKDSNGETYRSVYVARQALANDPSLRMFRHSLSMAGTKIEDVTDELVQAEKSAHRPPQ